MASTDKHHAQQTADSTAGRRTFIKYSLSILAANALIGKTIAATTASSTETQYVAIENFSSTGKSQGTARVAKVMKSDADWHKQLSAEAYQVTRNAGTEAPFTGQYWNNHADGLYRCICCDTALFDSKTKFESGTGWPSFWQSISALNVVKNADYSFGMERDAISCSRCDAHLGHVFDDGPKPTGLRYCMNSVSLHFVARG